jgi:hypothetical protein
MTGGGSGATTRQDKIFECWQRLIEGIEFTLKTLDLRCADQLHPGDAKLATEVKKVVLHSRQAFDHGDLYAGYGEDHADRRVRLIDGAIGFDSRMILGDPAAITQSCGAVIPGTRINFAQAVTHAENDSTGEAGMIESGLIDSRG